MLKACMRCGKVHPYGMCSIPYVRHRDYAKEYKGTEGRSREQKFRSTAAWQRKRLDILKRDNYCCRLCLHNGIINNKRIQVHHIVKLKDNYDMRLEDGNLISLCYGCHEQVESDKSFDVLLRRLAEIPPYQSIT